MYLSLSLGYFKSDSWAQVLLGDQKRSQLLLFSRNISAIVLRSLWTDGEFQSRSSVAGWPSSVCKDLLKWCVASIKIFSSFSDARWKPKSSQSCFTDGTLLSDTEEPGAIVTAEDRWVVDLVRSDGIRKSYVRVWGRHLIFIKTNI